jgi:hypothetical protein
VPYEVILHTQILEDCWDSLRWATEVIDHDLNTSRCHLFRMEHHCHCCSFGRHDFVSPEWP